MKTHCSTYWGTLFIRSVLEHEVLVLRNDVFGKEVVMSLNLAKTMRPAVIQIKTSQVGTKLCQLQLSKIQDAA